MDLFDAIAASHTSNSTCIALRRPSFIVCANNRPPVTVHVTLRI